MKISPDGKSTQAEYSEKVIPGGKVSHCVLFDSIYLSGKLNFFYLHVLVLGEVRFVSYKKINFF